MKTYKIKAEVNYRGYETMEEEVEAENEEDAIEAFLAEVSYLGDDVELRGDYEPEITLISKNEEEEEKPND